jgi:hypothetical protein
MSTAIAREKSAVERFDSGTHLAHKTRLEKGVFKHLPLIEQISVLLLLHQAVPLQQFRHGKARRRRQAREVGCHGRELSGWSREGNEVAKCIFTPPQNSQLHSPVISPER